MRELSQRTAKVMALVRAGETVEVTDRGEIVARIVPAVDDRYHQLVAAGVIRPAKRPFDIAYRSSATLPARPCSTSVAARHWTVALARHGASSVGIDSSPQQLEQTRRVVREAGLQLPLVLADAERLPFADESIDAVACDWGTMSFTEPCRSVPEVARVLRPGGLLTFSISSPLGCLCEQRHSWAKQWPFECIWKARKQRARRAACAPKFTA